MKEDEPRRKSSEDPSEAEDHYWPRFLSGLVHELKTPLASLGMVAELLHQESSGLSEKQERYAANIRELAQQMQDLVRDVGTLARLKGGRIEIREESVFLADLVRRASEMARTSAWERGVSLSVTIDPDLESSFPTHPGLLEKALEGLLEMAVFLADGEISLRVEARETEVVFAVHGDGGCGAADRASDLFDPFEGGIARRLEQRGVRPLAPLLAREIARVLGGELEIVPGNERSSCVLRLPRSDSVA